MDDVLEPWPVVAFFCVFFGVLAAMATLLAVSLRGMARHGVRGHLLGGKIVETVGALEAQSSRRWVSTKVSVERAETAGGPLVGLLVDHRYPTGLQIVPLALGPAEADELVRLLRAAAGER